MSEPNDRPPELGGDFPEIERSFDGTMAEEILRIVVEALNRQGYPDLSIDTLETNAAHRDAAIDMLRDCRPLPVIRELIDQLESRRLPSSIPHNPK